MQTEMNECNMKDENVPNKLPQPVTTRWWWFGISYDFRIKHWNVYVRIAKATLNIFGSKSCKNIVASNINSLMKGELFKHTAFLKYCKEFLINPNFDFYRTKDFD